MTTSPAPRLPGLGGGDTALSFADLERDMRHLTPEERAEVMLLLEDDLLARPVLPQPGPQTEFIEAVADIVVYGGAAFGGKSWALLYKPLQHLRTVPGFYAVLFRRTTTQIRKPGANWDESMTLYPRFGGHPTSHNLEWTWADGGKLKMDGLEYDASVLDWQTAQVAALLFDELTHFSRYQFFYLLSRNRSMSGVRPYVRAACNPDADSWVAEFLAWWIDQATGLPIPERAGVLRWFARDGEELVWADTREELVAKMGPECEPKSVTFIPAKHTDNKIGMAKDPAYVSNLKAQAKVERDRLLGGNWKVRASAGLLFRRAWCEVVDAAPSDIEWVRYWDLAGTVKTGDNDPDWTVGVKFGRQRLPNGAYRYFVGHVERCRESPHRVQETIINTAKADGKAVRIGLPQDPGQAGKAQLQALIAALAGYDASGAPETGDKITRFKPFSAQAEAGNIAVVRGAWNEAYWSMLEGFPEGKKDDADASSGALNMFTGQQAHGLDYLRHLAEQRRASDAAEAAKRDATP